MAYTTRLRDGLIVALVLAVLLGSALATGPALAQETTDDGMGGNETMSDGDSMGNETETMDDGNESMDDGMADDDDSMTEDDMDDEMTEDDMDDEMTEEEMMDDETASDGQSGFGMVVVLAALVAAAGFAIYRRRG